MGTKPKQSGKKEGGWGEFRFFFAKSKSGQPRHLPEYLEGRTPPNSPFLKHGGGSGIRTRDEVTPIQSFQDCALDQLCDPSLNPQQKSTIKKGKNKQITQNPKTPAKEPFKSLQQSHFP